MILKLTARKGLLQLSRQQKRGLAWFVVPLQLANV